MRIVGGALGGRRFEGPPGDKTRPTSERVREALASALASRSRLEGARVLDLYAGTGALAFEALSRGAASAVLVERDKLVAKALGKSIETLGLASRARVALLDLHLASVTSRLKALGPFDLVFADPPYAEIDAASVLLGQLVANAVLADDAFVVVEYARKHPPKSIPSLASVADYEYGDTSISFFRTSPGMSAP